MDEDEIKRRFKQFLKSEIKVEMGGLEWPTGQIWIEERKRVYQEYRIKFNVEGLDALEKEDFLEFLQFRNNFSWIGLYRWGNRAAENMKQVRNALKVLLDEEIPIRDRLNKILKRDSQSHVDGLGKNLATSILMVSQPDLYGVMNEKALDAIAILGRIFRVSSNPGRSYEGFNEYLRELATKLNTDLISLDGFLWYLCEDIEPPKRAVDKDSKSIKIASEQISSGYNNVLLIIDGPNSLGLDFSDRLDLKTVRDYAYSLDKTAKLYYLTKLHNYPINKQEISRLGYRIMESHKDIDHLMRDEIQDKLKSKRPPNILLLGTKDHDLLNFIKEIKETHNIIVILTISSKKGLAKSLEPVVDDIKFFPEVINTGIRVEIIKLTSKGTYMARHADGRIVFITSNKKLSSGNQVMVQIIGENPKKTVYFATLIKGLSYNG